jgi:hypothetical protein
VDRTGPYNKKTDHMCEDKQAARVGKFLADFRPHVWRREKTSAEKNRPHVWTIQVRTKENRSHV